jgi:hypothetical protein
VTPANLPFAVPGPTAGDVFVHAREATVGTGIYLAPGEPEPGIAVQAVFDVLGIDRRDVATDVPPAVLASASRPTGRPIRIRTQSDCLQSTRAPVSCWPRHCARRC